MTKKNREQPVVNAIKILEYSIFSPLFAAFFFPQQTLGFTSYWKKGISVTVSEEQNLAGVVTHLGEGNIDVLRDKTKG